MEEVILPYGDTQLNIDISKFNLLGVLKPKYYPEIKSKEKAIYNALRSPLYGPPLIDLAKNKKSAVIIVSDKTRRTFIREIIPFILEELSKGGIPTSRVTIVIAVGAHPMLKDEEIKDLLGEEVVEAVTVVNHNCRDTWALKYIGVTSRGTPIYINKLVLEADLKILTGAINYHDFAGFSGGAKSILPGVSGFSTISHNHLLLLNPEFGSGYNPEATSGILSGNPVHEDMEEVASLVKPEFLINVVFNAEMKLSQIVSGNWKLAHSVGCKIAKGIFSSKVKEKSDVGLVSSGGFPFDINFYQAMKSIINTLPLVKDGGNIILLASCKEGLGEDGFREWLKKDDVEKLERDLRAEFNMVGKIAYDVKVRFKNIKVMIVTDLSEEEVSLFGFKKAIDSKEALKSVLSNSDKPNLYVIPYGNITVGRR